MSEEATQAEPTGQQDAAAPRRRRLRPRHALRVAGMVLSLPVIFAIVAALTMLGREITAPSWVRAAVVERAAVALAGGSVDFRDIKVTLGTDLHPRVVLRDAVLRDAEGMRLAEVPRIEGLLSPRGLLKGRLLAQEVRLTGAQVSLRRGADGSVGLSFGMGTEVGQAENFAALLEDIDRLFANGPLEALEQVRAEGVIVNYDDARAQRSWTVDGGRLRLDLRGGVTALSADVALLSGRAWPTRLRFDWQSPRASRAASIRVEIEDAVGPDIATQSPALSWLGVVDAPISGTLEGALDEAGALGPLAATLILGEGVIQAGPATRPVPFAGGESAFTYDPVAGRIRFDRIAMDSAWGRIEGRGQALMEGLSFGWPEALVGQFEIDALAVNPAGAFAEPVALEAVNFEARMRLDPFALRLGEVVALIDGVPLVLSGEIEGAAEGWGVALDARIASLEIGRGLSLWPETFRPGLRGWFVRNLTAGRLGDVAVAVRAAPGQVPRIGLTTDFEALDARFIRTLPPLQGAAGRLSWVDRRLVVSLSDGHVAAPQGGRVEMAGSVMEIPRTGPPGAPAHFELALSGTVTAAMALLDLPPFEVLKNSDLPVTLADGRIAAALRLDMPLRDNTTREERDWAVEARITGLRSEQLVAGRELRAAELRLTAEPAALTITGPVRLSDVPAEITYARGLGPGSAGTGRIAAQVEVTPGALAAFGIGLPAGMVSGAGLADLELDLGTGAAPGFVLRSDLRGVGLALPGLGWTKPRGGTGRLEIEGALGVRPRIDRVALSAAGLEMAGRITLAPGGGLERADFTRLAVGDWFDAAVTLIGRGPGSAPRIELAGGRIDLRRLQPAAGGGAAGGPMLVALDRVQVTEAIALTGFRGEFTTLGGFSGTFTGALNGAAPVEGTLIPSENGAAFRILSDDAGAVLRAAGLVPGARSGALELVLRPTGVAGSYDGRLTASNLRVRDAPALASVLDAISVVGLLSQLDGQGLLFNDVEALFRITPLQIVITRASAVGPGLGISLDGIYDTASRSVDFQGVVSPFYVLNGIGAVLTRPGEGLIGFNFTLQGPVDRPRVLVNPLSVLTPGMFREIFRRPPPRVGQ